MDWSHLVAMLCGMLLSVPIRSLWRALRRLPAPRGAERLRVVHGPDVTMPTDQAASWCDIVLTAPNVALCYRMPAAQARILRRVLAAGRGRCSFTRG